MLDTPLIDSPIDISDDLARAYWRSVKTGLKREQTLLKHMDADATPEWEYAAQCARVAAWYAAAQDAYQQLSQLQQIEERTPTDD